MYEARKMYEVLKQAGAPQDTAREAAEELAEHKNRFANAERKLSVLQWQTAYLMVMTTGIALRLIFSQARVLWLRRSRRRAEMSPAQAFKKPPLRTRIVSRLQFERTAQGG